MSKVISATGREKWSIGSQRNRDAGMSFMLHKTVRSSQCGIFYWKHHRRKWGEERSGSVTYDLGHRKTIKWFLYGKVLILCNTWGLSELAKDVCSLWPLRVALRALLTQEKGKIRGRGLWDNQKLRECRGVVWVWRDAVETWRRDAKRVFKVLLQGIHLL